MPASSERKAQRQFGLLQITGVQNFVEVGRTGRSSGPPGQVRGAEEIEALALGLDAEGVAHIDWARLVTIHACEV